MRRRNRETKPNPEQANGESSSTMTETKTEDDDDEGSGNFYFASLPYNPTVNSNQINGLKPTTTQCSNDDDDEWGDFIEYPLRSELSSGLSHTQSPSNQSQPSKPFDSFEFFPDQSTSKPSEPVPSLVESGKTQWVKPKGALPLSIFGDAEEEEETGRGDPHVDNGKDAFGDKRLVGNVKSESIVYFGGEVSDIISNLYNQSQQIKAENGSISTSTPEMNGSILNLSGLSLNPDLVGGKKDLDILTNLHDQGRQIKAENGSDLIASSLKLGGLSLEFNEYNSDSNWPQSSLNAPISHLSGLNLEIHGFTSNLNERNVAISTVTGLNSNFGSSGRTEGIDADDDGWEFQVASSEPKVGDGNDKGPSASELPGFKVQWAMGQEMQVERKGQETSEVNTQSSGLDNGSHGSVVDRFATSNEFSSKSCEIDIGSVLKLNAVAENGFISETFFRSEQDDAENGLNSYPIVERADFDESFGHFTAAFPETGSKQEAEKDLRSAIGLLQHASTVLKILTLGSIEEQSNYITMWSKILSVCAQELKHGAWIWKQSIEQNLQNRILIKPQGKRFILALGEIYRVVVILRASARLYKPWILSSSENPIAIYALLEECHTLWTSSGLEEALSGISDPFGSENKGIAEVLVDSIKYIHDTDEPAHGNHVFTHQQESKCRLSLLTPGVVPGMKMIVWNREHYFLTLANLWANLISCDPPRLNVG